MRLALALLAIAGSGFFLWLARRPLVPQGRPTRMRVLGARAVRGIYVVSAAALLVRGLFGLIGMSG
jgi:uncharacterized iron-regulated membrane protein